MAETSNRAGEKGTIVQIIGAVVDVEFPEGHIPELYDALDVKGDGKNFNPTSNIIRADVAVIIYNAVK